MDGWMNGGMDSWIHGWIEGWMDASSEDRPRVSHTNPPCLSVGSAPSSSPSILGIIRVWISRGMLELLTPTPSTAAAPNPAFPTPTETWIPSRFPLRQGKHPGAPAGTGSCCAIPRELGAARAAPGSCRFPGSRFIPGSFACRAVPRQQTLRGCQRRGCVGLMISSPRGRIEAVYPLPVYPRVPGAWRLFLRTFGIPPSPGVPLFPVGINQGFPAGQAVKGGCVMGGR